MKKTMAAVMAALLLLTAGCGASGGAETAAAAPDYASVTAEAISRSAPAAEEETSVYTGEYADTLFDTSYVHSIDIRLTSDRWDDFIANCEDEEYLAVDLVIDGEPVEGAAIRAKGNSSMMRSRTSGKYSFKIEFDHFSDDLLFRGLDKLCLNNLSGDESCLRDYLVYRLMDEFGVPSPLCSYVFVTVGGEDWGLYLAVEGIEESFLMRNYGDTDGHIYKPDNLTGGGGGGGARGGGVSSRGDDVKLKYIDDDPASYPNIFSSAKTDVSRKDQYRLINSLRLLSEGEDLDTVLDIDEILRYLVVQEFVCNGDSYIGSSVHNYYLYEEDGRLAMLPWDYNEAFGDFGSSGMASVANSPIDSPFGGAAASERPMAAWVFTDETYIERYHTLYQRFLEKLIYSGRAEQLITEARELIGPYVARDPRSYATYEEFLSGAEEHIAFFRVRAESVQGQLDGTIPSTVEGQAADSSSLVDTSALPGRGGSGGMAGGPSGRPGARTGARTAAAGARTGNNTVSGEAEASADIG